MKFEDRHLGSAHFPADLDDIEIGYFFGLDDQARSLIRTSRGPLNRIGLALHSGFLKMTGRCLNSVQTIPKPVLDRIGQDLRLAVPDLASIRSLYRRRRTLYDHQKLAAEFLRRADLNEHAERALTAHLRREASSIFSTIGLERRAATWLVEHGYLLPSSRRMRRLSAAALTWREQRLAKQIRAAVGGDQASRWADALRAPSDAGRSLLEYLSTAPRSRAPAELDRQIERVEALRVLGADKLGLPDLTMATLVRYGDLARRRKPSMLGRIKEPRRTLELACFLRRSLMQATDVAAALIQSQTTDLWRRSRDRAIATEARQFTRYRRLVVDLDALIRSEEMSADEMRQRIGIMIKDLSPDQMPGRLKLTRLELAKSGSQPARLVAAARQLGVVSDRSHPLEIAFAGLDAGASAGQLPTDFDNPFGSSWAALIAQPNREAALAASAAATTMLLKRSLSNGTAWFPHSDAWRAPKDRLITAEVWARDRGRLVRDLGISGQTKSFLDRIDAGLMVSLSALDEAVRSGEVRIGENGKVSFARPEPSRDKAARARVRRTIQSAIGSAELPEIMIALDAEAGFSKILLGRDASSERELVTLYAAVLAAGTDLSATDLERMVPALDADAIGRMMCRLEAEDVTRNASDAVVTVMRRNQIVSNWGPGVTASCDMMSLDATRRLWNARTDPKRRVFATGAYTHVLDQWGIIYDQPIVLGKRQAGAAIQGVTNQTQIALERLAVDTHGFTHFGMALAKLLGFDLCPRLRGLTSRKLFVPAGVSIPNRLQPLIAGTIHRRKIEQGWEGLLLAACSVNSGWTPATWVLDRYGSNARGDPVFVAGDALGKLLKTHFLCDYLTQLAFRAEIQSLLSQGEAVHVLQRAIHNGPIRSRKGRTHDEMAAISGCLTLLANIIMAWNTKRLQSALDSGRLSMTTEALASTSPITHAHINLRGRYTFNLSEFGDKLLPGQPYSQPHGFARKAENL